MLMCSSLNVAYTKKTKKVDVILKAVVSSESLLWQIQICVNASTAILLDENDCTYNIIIILEKTVSDKKKMKNMPHFLLVLNECNIILIPMINKVSFLLLFIFDTSAVLS